MLNEEQRPRMERLKGVWVLDGFIGAPCVGFPFAFLCFLFYFCVFLALFIRKICCQQKKRVGAHLQIFYNSSGVV